MSNLNIFINYTTSQEESLEEKISNIEINPTLKELFFEYLKEAPYKEEIDEFFQIVEKYQKWKYDNNNINFWDTDFGTKILDLLSWDEVQEEKELQEDIQQKIEHKNKIKKNFTTSINNEDIIEWCNQLSRYSLSILNKFKNINRYPDSNLISELLLLLLCIDNPDFYCFIPYSSKIFRENFYCCGQEPQERPSLRDHKYFTKAQNVSTIFKILLLQNREELHKLRKKSNRYNLNNYNFSPFFFDFFLWMNEKGDFLWTNEKEEAKLPVNIGLSSNDVNNLLIEDYNQEKEKKKQEQEKCKSDIKKELFLNSENLEEIIKLLERKRNVILQGPAGIGKTFVTKRIAYYMMGKQDDTNIEEVQFHQSYSYEDFIEGYKPEVKENNNDSANKEDSNVQINFSLSTGIFKEFCEKAKEKSDEKFFFIIDEINRGNLSKIFGELLRLVEKPYREKESVILPYSREKFSIPDNIYIIGTMNTTDRSLIKLDYAMKRRFSFVTLTPAFSHKNFKESANKKSTTFQNVIKSMEELNKNIKNDPDLGAGFCIGHSYFCINDENEKEALQLIIKYDILPIIEEYENIIGIEQSSIFNDWRKSMEQELEIEL